MMHNEPCCEEPQAHLMGSRYIWFLALLLLPCVNTTCFGQTVTIRIVNVANETPVRNKKIDIFGITETGAAEQDERRKLITKSARPDLRFVTDANGEAKFELPKPAPTYFYVLADLSGPRWDCFCLVRVSTEEMTQKGFMTRSAYSARTTPSVQPKPGEILFEVRPTPWWMQILYPLLKD